MGVKQRINDVNMLNSDPIITYNAKITSVANTLKKIHLSTIILNELTSTCYDDKDDCFSFLFQQYTAISVKNIDHPALVIDQKSNMEK